MIHFLKYFDSLIVFLKSIPVFSLGNNSNPPTKVSGYKFRFEFWQEKIRKTLKMNAFK